jgi:hypothetical protein
LGQEEKTASEVLHAGTKGDTKGMADAAKKGSSK